MAKGQVVRTVEHAKYSSIPNSLLWPKKRLFTFCGLNNYHSLVTSLGHDYLMSHECYSHAVVWPDVTHT